MFQKKQVSFALPQEVFASTTEDTVGMLNRGQGDTPMNLDLPEDIRLTN